MLGDWQGYAGNIRLLKGVLAYEEGVDLTCYGNHRHRVHVGRGNPCYKVGCSRTGGGYAHAYLTGRSGIPVSHVRRTLLVAHKDVPYVRVIDCIVEGQQYSAGKAENYVNPFSLQALQYRLSAGHSVRRVFLRQVFSPPQAASAY
ncbi:Uncharacterised protein [uncultured archaeon]|nr:Uncharacterised protein [uncultured archaeon]